MAILTNDVKPQDVIITEFDYRFCREAGVLTNDFGAELTMEVGMLTKGAAGGAAFTPCDTGDTATGICLTKVDELADSGTMNVVVLNKGPAVVDSSLLLDAGGDALAAVKANLLAVDIKVVDPPTLTSEGTPVIP